MADEVQLDVARKRAHQIAAAGLEALGGRRVEPRGALELARERGILCGGDVAAVRLGPDLAQEGEEALGNAGRLELVAQHRGERDA